MRTPLTLHDIAHRRLPPAPWSEGDNIPWDDPGFSQRMLAVHLAQTTDLASRRNALIEQQVSWIFESVLGGKGGRVLDLACGPGLYLNHLCRRGCTGHGIDFAPAAVTHANEVAAGDGLDASFELADLRDADFGEGFELALLIYGQLNVFERGHARAILTKAFGALSSGGTLILEPQTTETVREIPAPTWTTETNGLFSEAPHLLLHEAFWHEASQARTDRWFVVGTACDAVERYAMSCVAWPREALADLLGEIGFVDVEVLPALGEVDGDEAAAFYAVRAVRP